MWGPSHTLSASGFRFYILIVDDFSRHSWLFPVKHKSDFYRTFVDFCNLVENQFDLAIKAIRTDSGGEFTN